MNLEKSLWRSLRFGQVFGSHKLHHVTSRHSAQGWRSNDPTATGIHLTRPGSDGRLISVSFIRIQHSAIVSWWHVRFIESWNVMVLKIVCSGQSAIEFWVEIIQVHH